jgi:signal transduction histidine kinase
MAAGESKNTRHWLTMPALIASTALVFGAFQLQTFPKVNDVGVEVFSEGALLPVLIASLFLVGTLDLEADILRRLYAGLLLMLVYGVTETADELVALPLAFSIVAEHFAVVCGCGFLVAGLWRWGRTRNERIRTIARKQDLLERTEHQAGVGGWQFDPQTEDLRWTPGMRTIHDCPPTFDPTRENTLEFYSPPEQQKMDEAVERCLDTGQPFEVELEVALDRSGKRWLLTRGERVMNDGTPKVRGITQDITEQKQREQRLNVLNRVLRHNLRNNLTTIIGYAQTVQSELDTLDLPEQNDEATAVHPQLREFSTSTTQQHLELIIESSEELRTVARKARELEQVIEPGESNESVAVSATLRELASEYREFYPDATIEVSVTDAVISGSRPALKLAVGELLDNTLLHNDNPEPVVKVETNCTDETVDIHVIDTGPGIPETERSVLEEGTETPLSHTTGIGLWSAEWLTTQLGGHITLEDNDPRGTVVTITVPTISE